MEENNWENTREKPILGDEFSAILSLLGEFDAIHSISVKHEFTYNPALRRGNYHRLTLLHNLSGEKMWIEEGFIQQYGEDRLIRDICLWLFSLSSKLNNWG